MIQGWKVSLIQQLRSKFEILSKHSYDNLTNQNKAELNHLNFSMSWKSLILTQFMPLAAFYTPWKRQNTRGFLVFPGGIESGQWHEMG